MTIKPAPSIVRFAISFALLAGLCGTLRAHAGGDWTVALPGWRYEFPRDHGSHRDFKTEWWYFTGNLKAAGGQEFGYQLTFFRQGVVPPGRSLPESAFLVRDVPFAHFAVSDLAGGAFYHFQKLSRGAFGEAGFDDGRRVAWNGAWSCECREGDGFFLRAKSEGVEIDLELESLKPVVVHGAAGVSQKAQGEGRASHYYSLTRLATRGTVRLNGRDYKVSGFSWFDHEWATNQLAADQTGWDWFSLHFEDGSDFMFFQIRTRDGGRDSHSSGTWVEVDGNVTKIDRFELKPVEWWTSPHSGGRYPVEWQIVIPDREVSLRVRARMHDQELSEEPFAYWEGAVTAQGTRRGEPIFGKGYLEMTGYAGRIVGMQAAE